MKIIITIIYVLVWIAVNFMFELSHKDIKFWLLQLLFATIYFGVICRRKEE